MTHPKTLTEAIRYYSDEQTCIDAIAAIRWADGKPVCPKCNTAEGERKHYWLAVQKRWKCYSCRKQFSVKVGSIFEDSPLTLDKWLVSLWLLVNCKNGVSSYEIARATGMGQKAAWFVLQRLRHILKETAPKTLGGYRDNPVEIDETWIGGRPKNMHVSRRREIGQTDHKTIVMGMMERKTRQVRAQIVPNIKRATLQKEILERVGFGATIYTDSAASYDGIDRTRYVHETVNHMEEFVRGKVSTQAIENFWSCLKRTLNGTYVAVEAVHMNSYLAEQCFRFNNRIKMNDGDRFTKALAEVGGKRLTWNELTGKEAASA
ncbi:IS1595 family transposase [Granulicella sibirica]|uniref:ISSpo8, transposase n=1 Tax=Granulicella sibirica TaxID=2479048 RepID=A0A4Q0T4Y8_9BACT|nr:IS1595 family transposase [Granulicella sibirica]RXH58427.1 ISSpo8, transposase [Granulicella sibirica]